MPGAEIVYGALFDTVSREVEISWDNVQVKGSPHIMVWVVSGGVDLSITQESMAGNVSFEVKSSRGVVNLDVDISGDMGATIESDPSSNSVDVEAGRLHGLRLVAAIRQLPFVQRF